MEKIFTPNRWFIGFCALLIVVVGALKIVGDMHIAEEAKLVAQGIFNFDWPELGIESRVQSINAHVISHSEHDAVVEVTGRQYIAKLAPQPVAEPKAETPAPNAAGTTAPNAAGTPDAAKETAAAPAPNASEALKGAPATTPAPAPATKLVAAGPPENAEFKAILTFYRANNAWELGKVEQVN